MANLHEWLLGVGCDPRFWMVFAGAEMAPCDGLGGGRCTGAAGRGMMLVNDWTVRS